MSDPSPNGHPPHAEQLRLDHDRTAWMRWGPYVSERAWGTVREDYSAEADPWKHFTYDHARSRAYRWSEDGLGGLCDDHQRLCLSVALWNGRDQHLKERLFGTTNEEGNHGEDVKEVYHYLDATPTHSYLKFLYKYPQAAFPYRRLVEESRRRSRDEPEYELHHTGVFDENRYFDVAVEYAKAGPDDVLIKITAHNRGPDPAELHVLPTAWFRNTWSWRHGATRPTLKQAGPGVVAAEHRTLGKYHWHLDGDAGLLFCDNDTNSVKLYDAPPRPGWYYKDGIDEYVVNGNWGAVNPAHTGTKAAAHYRFLVAPGKSAVVRARLRQGPAAKAFADFDEVFAHRLKDADDFYHHLQHGITDPDARRVQRQAFAGMLWTKQFYHVNVPEWLAGDPAQPPPPKAHKLARNTDWEHVNTYDVLSMPDKWEYPYFCAWDTAFHMLPFAVLDPQFAKDQLVLLTREWYMHPNGQLPAYEWDFGDVNPPVHAWACWRVYQIDRRQNNGRGDLKFLERVFHKLLLNFTWWVNRKDTQGRNVFQGGFLGLDNIGVFDRSKPLPTGGFINQADGTAWMAMYSLNLLRMALELSLHNPVYQDTATKFFEHFLHIAEAMTDMAGQGIGLWDEADEFYYDELMVPGADPVKLRVRSMVGLIPMFAVETLEPELLARVPEFTKRMEWFLKYAPDLSRLVSRWDEPGRGQRRLLSLLRGSRLKKLLKRMLDETEFLSDYGVRSLSKAHEREPYTLRCDGHTLSVGYWPAESHSGMFGGNSNWRGPVWLPVNYLIIESLQKFHHYYTEDFRVECPTGSGRFCTLEEVAEELTRRLCRLFLRDDHGKRPLFGSWDKWHADPHFRDNLVFPEFFDGDTGRGCGSMHQTGWTGLIAKLLHPRRREGGGVPSGKRSTVISLPAAGGPPS